jgi:hypothetical protein
MNDFTSQWEAHRRLRRNFLWTFCNLLAFDVVFLGLDLKLGFTSKYYLQYRLLVIAGWVVPMIFQADKLISWPCPRCGEPFASGNLLERATSFGIRFRWNARTAVSQNMQSRRRRGQRSIHNERYRPLTPPLQAAHFPA